MDSKFTINAENSNEGNKECETKLLTDCTNLPNALCTRQRRKLQFKSPLLQKKLKLETKDSETTEEKISTNNSEEKENTLRRSKRKKNQNSSTNTGKESFDINILKNGMKCEAETAKQSNLNIISDNVINILDRTFFSEDMICNSSAEDISEQNKFLTKSNNLIECHLAEDNGNTTNKKIIEDKISNINQDLRKKSADDEILNLPNKLHTNFDNGATQKKNYAEEKKVENNKCSEIDTDVKLTLDTKNEKKCERNFSVAKAQNCSMNAEDDECVLNKNDSPNSITVKNISCQNREIQMKVELINNKSLQNDINLDQLNVDIKSADTIINLLANAEKAEKCCVSKDHKKEKNNETSDQNNTSKKNMKQNNFDNENGLTDGSFSGSEECDNYLQEKTLKNENKGIIKNTSSETITHPNVEEKNSKAKNNTVSHINIIKHDMNSNSRTDEYVDEMVDANFDKSSSKEYDSTVLETNMKIFPLGNNSKYLHRAEEFNMEQKFIGDSGFILNENVEKQGDKNNLGNQIQDSNEIFEMKQKKLTLLYMTALDYEKEELNESKEINDDLYKEFKNSKNSDSNKKKNSETFEHDLKYTFNELYDQNTKEMSLSKIDGNINEDEESSKLKEKNDMIILQNLSDMNKNVADNFTEENPRQLIHDLYSIPSTNNDQYQINEDEITVKYDLTDKKDENSQICGSRQHKTSLFQDKSISLPQFSVDDSQDRTINDNITEMKIEKTDKCYKNKYLNDEIPFLVTATDCFDLELKNFTRKISSKDEDLTRSNENVINSKDESKATVYDAEESFDMDDDFDLTASQINMIDANEENLLKESSNTKITPCQQTQGTSNTHFGHDSITVEIIDQLCYIRESIESIKELLSTLLKKEDFNK